MVRRDEPYVGAQAIGVRYFKRSVSLLYFWLVTGSEREDKRYTAKFETRPAAGRCSAVYSAAASSRSMSRASSKASATASRASSTPAS